METFIVRVFVPAADGDTQIAGVVEHVGSGWSSHFGSEDELFSAFRSWLERERSRSSATPERARG